MQDLTSGSIPRHLLRTTSFMLVMMVVQTLYFLVDLYWVGRIGTDAVAGVAVAGNVSVAVLALGQVLAVGTTALVAQAAGRKDPDAVRHAFDQALALGICGGLLFLAVALGLANAYAAAMTADAGAARAAADYLAWFVPAMALQFPLNAVSAALRGTGDFRTPTTVSTASVLLNAALAPVLIGGLGTGRPMGVAGAGLASFVAVAVAFAWVVVVMIRREGPLRLAPSAWRPELATWRRLLGVGLPSGFEFAMMGLFQAVVYIVARPFGPAAQAGFGIGFRVVQAGFLPVVALGLAVAPVAGQNVGARRGDRVRQTFRTGATLAVAYQACFLLAAQLLPAPMVGVFTRDPAVLATGVEYVRLISWGFLASGVVFVASSMFQALGNTIPSLLASGTRMTLLIVPVVLLARQTGFRLSWIWVLAAATMWLQLVLALWLLRRTLAGALGPSDAAPHAPVLEAAG